MANANPDDTIRSENDMEVDSTDGETDPPRSNIASANGEIGMGVMVIADRYGFLGGNQYTKPEE